VRPVVAVCLAVSAFVGGFAFTSRDASAQSGYNLCIARCEQRYQACIANGVLAPAVCESNRQACLAVCNQ
jgi:hypothetical protein